MFRDRHGRTVAAALALGCATATGLLVIGMPRPRHSSPDETGRFVVGFELRADEPQDLVWPHPTFPPADYTRVLLVAERMPLVRTTGSSELPRALPASQFLRINGSLRTPRLSSSAQTGQQGAEEFVVDLESGRLRLSLFLPPGAEVDPLHGSAHITLYENGLGPLGHPSSREIPSPSR